jgi:hypothetical protein
MRQTSYTFYFTYYQMGVIKRVIRAIRGRILRLAGVARLWGRRVVTQGGVRSLPRVRFPLVVLKNQGYRPVARVVQRRS